jgi:hypothetical protein
MSYTTADKQTNIEGLDDCGSPGTLQSSSPVQSQANSSSATEASKEDSWLINWSNVEVPDSPDMSRLFSALEIECSNPVPVLSLEPGYLPAVPRCISECQIQDLFNDENKVLNSYNNQLYSSEHSKPSLPLPLASSKMNLQNALPPLQDFAAAVFFGYSASPLNELYVFSPAPSTSVMEVDLSERTVWGSLAAQETDLQTKLTKLKPHFGIDHPLVIKAMQSLCQTY